MKEYFKQAALYTCSPTCIVTGRKKRRHYHLHCRLLKEIEIQISERKKPGQRLKVFFKNYSDSASGLLILPCTNSRRLILFVKPYLSKCISFLLSLLY